MKFFRKFALVALMVNAQWLMVNGQTQTIRLACSEGSECAELTFEQDILAGLDSFMHERCHVAEIRLDECSNVLEVSEDLCRIQRICIRIEACDGCILDDADALDLLGEIFVIELCELEADLHGLIGVVRRDTGLCRTEAVLAEALLFQLIEEDMIRHDELCAVGDADLRRRDIVLLQHFKFLLECIGVECSACTDDIDRILLEDTRGANMQGIFAVLIDDRMAGIGTALKANDIIRIGCEDIGQFTLAFIAPVSAYYCSNHNAARSFPFEKSDFSGIAAALPQNYPRMSYHKIPNLSSAGSARWY